jgi:nitrous oxide reductase accessory protein NosL
MTAALSLALMLCIAVAASAQGPVRPGHKDKCPVCGMFVAPYSEWVAQIVFNDGSYTVFDGAKDMFRYYFDMERYAGGKGHGDIAEIYVTDYYTTKILPASDAYFVLGSDVAGPMGEELVPVMGEREARIFMTDHGGKRLLRFGEVTASDLPK